MMLRRKTRLESRRPCVAPRVENKRGESTTAGKDLDDATHTRARACACVVARFPAIPAEERLSRWIMLMGSFAKMIVEQAAIATATAAAADDDNDDDDDDDAMTVKEANREEKQAAPICLAHPDATKTKREEIADE